MRTLLARILFAIALVFFRLATGLVGKRIYLVHQLEDAEGKKYRRLVERGEWNR